MLLPFLANHFSLNSTNHSYAEEITWSADRRLNWDDFKGVPSGKKVTGAVTYSTIKAVPTVSGFWNNRVDVEVKAVFRCDRSWAKDRAKESEYLLNHEQRHFDIAEIYARKIREALEKYEITPNNYPRIKAQVIEKLFREYVDFDEQYDHLTVHGLKKTVQEEWDLDIDQTLGLEGVELESGN